MSPNTQLNIFADRDKFFFSRISKKPVCFSGKHKVANLNPYSKGWTTETGVVVLALINVPCKSSLNSDVKNDFCYPLSFLSCKYIRKGRERTQKSVRKYQKALAYLPWVGGWGKELMEVSIVFFFTKEPAKAKQFLPFLQRAGRSSGIVEVSGSLTCYFRMKWYNY